MQLGHRLALEHSRSYTAAGSIIPDVELQAAELFPCRSCRPRSRCPGHRSRPCPGWGPSGSIAISWNPTPTGAARTLMSALCDILFKGPLPADGKSAPRPLQLRAAVSRRGSSGSCSGSSLSMYAQIWTQPVSVVHGATWLRTRIPQRVPDGPAADAHHVEPLRENRRRAARWGLATHPHEKLTGAVATGAGSPYTQLANADAPVGDVCYLLIRLPPGPGAEDQDREERQKECRGRWAPRTRGAASKLTPPRGGQSRRACCAGLSRAKNAFTRRVDDDVATTHSHCG